MKKDEKNKKEKENSKAHFVEVINYAKEEPWRTDMILGQKSSKSHGHLALSGATAWYFKTESGDVIIENGSIINDTSQPQSAYAQNTLEESQHPKQSYSENGDD